MSDTTEGYEESSNTIVTGFGGRVFYRRVGPDGEVVAGCPIWQAKTTEYQRLLPQAAELDFRLYELLRNGYTYIHELDHIVTSFIDHAGGIPDGKDWLPPFREWANLRLQDISEEIQMLHELIGGSHSEIQVPKRFGLFVDFSG